MHVLLAIHQYVAVNKDFVNGEALPLPIFCPVLDLPLGISGRNHYQKGNIQSKAFCL